MGDTSVEFANRWLTIHLKPDAVFPTKLKRVEGKANVARFVWTIAERNAYASFPKCVSDAGP
jgi:hypothetical protein